MTTAFYGNDGGDCGDEGSDDGGDCSDDGSDDGGGDNNNNNLFLVHHNILNALTIKSRIKSLIN